MALKRPVSTYFTVLAVVTFAGAGWSWWSVQTARAPIAALEAQVGTLRQNVARLATLPDLPALPPLTETLKSFLGVIEPPLTVKFSGPADKDKSLLTAVPNMPGVRLTVVEVTDPKPGVDLPQLSLATLAGWQRRWPLQLARVVWDGRAVTATLTLYGR